MKYIIKVTVQNPKDLNETITYDLTASFIHNEELHGSGYYVSIVGEKFCRRLIELQYDESFDPNNKVEWLELWARNYWTGENGFWKIKNLKIIKQ